MSVYCSIQHHWMKKCESTNHFSTMVSTCSNNNPNTRHHLDSLDSRESSLRSCRVFFVSSYVCSGVVFNPTSTTLGLSAALELHGFFWMRSSDIEKHTCLFLLLCTFPASRSTSMEASKVVQHFFASPIPELVQSFFSVKDIRKILPDLPRPHDPHGIYIYITLQHGKALATPNVACNL